MRHTPLKFAIAFILFTPVLLFGQQSEWKLAKSGDGVEVYTRKRAKGDIKEFKATTVVNVAVSKVEQLLDDVDRYPNWQDNCEEAELVKRIDDRTIIGRYTSETPWPFNDRDVVLKMTKLSTADGGVVYQVENAPDAYPIVDDFERIPRAGGKWELRPKGEDQCAVTYEFYADPGGNVPKWLVNMFIVQGPYNSFVRMKEILH